jgi:DNA-binding PadR family transcriptional regulator
MATLSNKETALLGLLSEGPMHAYMIEKEIENRSMREWTEISMSSVYKLLNKLDSKGFIKSEIKLSKKNVSQKVYGLTSTGRRALKRRIKELLSKPERMIYRIDLATSHLGQLSKAEAAECLEKYGQKLADGIKCYGELEKYLINCKCPRYGLALARRPRHLLRAELEWVKEYEKELE